MFSYVAFNDDFYEVVLQKKRIALLKRLTYNPFKAGQKDPVMSTPTREVVTTRFEVTFFLRKNGEADLYKVVDLKKKLATYFSDCPTLAADLKAGEYKVNAFVESTERDDEKEQALVDVVNTYEACP